MLNVASTGIYTKLALFGPPCILQHRHRKCRTGLISTLFSSCSSTLEVYLYMTIALYKWHFTYLLTYLHAARTLVQLGYAAGWRPVPEQFVYHPGDEQFPSTTCQPAQVWLSVLVMICASYHLSGVEIKCMSARCATRKLQTCITTCDSDVLKTIFSTSYSSNNSFHVSCWRNGTQLRISNCGNNQSVTHCPQHTKWLSTTDINSQWVACCSSLLSSFFWQQTLQLT